MKETKQDNSEKELSKLLQSFIVVTPNKSQDAFSIDLKNVFRAWRKYGYIIFTVVVLSILSSVALINLITPRYKAEVKLQPVVSENQSQVTMLLGQLSNLTGLGNLGGLSGSSGVETMLATLQSRSFLTRFIEDNKLLPILFSELWDKDKKKWKSQDVNKIPSMWIAYNYFVKNVLIVNYDGVAIVNVGVIWRDRKLATEWANELVKTFNNYQKKKAIEEADRSIQYLTEKINSTNVVEMQQVLYTLIAAQTKIRMLATIRDDFALKIIDPAFIPDKESYIYPNKPLIIVITSIIGLVIGLVLPLVIMRIKEKS